MLFINSKGFYTSSSIKTEEGENNFVVVIVLSEDEMLFDPRLWNSLTLRSIIC